MLYCFLLIFASLNAVIEEIKDENNKIIELKCNEYTFKFDLDNDIKSVQCDFAQNYPTQTLKELFEYLKAQNIDNINDDSSESPLITFEQNEERIVYSSNLDSKFFQREDLVDLMKIFSDFENAFFGGKGIIPIELLKLYKEIQFDISDSRIILQDGKYYLKIGLTKEEKKEFIKLSDEESGKLKELKIVDLDGYGESTIANFNEFQPHLLITDGDYSIVKSYFDRECYIIFDFSKNYPKEMLQDLFNFLKEKKKKNILRIDEFIFIDNGKIIYWLNENAKLFFARGDSFELMNMLECEKAEFIGPGIIPIEFLSLYEEVFLNIHNSTLILQDGKFYLKIGVTQEERFACCSNKEKLKSAHHAQFENLSKLKIICYSYEFNFEYFFNSALRLHEIAERMKQEYLSYFDQQLHKLKDDELIDLNLLAEMNDLYRLDTFFYNHKNIKAIKDCEDNPLISFIEEDTILIHTKHCSQQLLMSEFLNILQCHYPQHKFCFEEGAMNIPLLYDAKEYIFNWKDALNDCSIIEINCELFLHFERGVKKTKSEIFESYSNILKDMKILKLTFGIACEIKLNLEEFIAIEQKRCALLPKDGNSVSKVHHMHPSSEHSSSSLGMIQPKGNSEHISKTVISNSLSNHGGISLKPIIESKVVSSSSSSSSSSIKVEPKGFISNVFEKIKSGIWSIFATFNSFFKKIFALFSFKK